MNSDLIDMLEEVNVSSDMIAFLRQSGVKSVTDFAGLEISPEGLSKLLLASLKSDTIETKLQVGRVVLAWETARKNYSARRDVKAVCKAHGDTLELLPSDHNKLVQAYELSKGGMRIDSSLLPSCGLLESIFEQLDTGDMVAETLSLFISAKEESKDRKRGLMDPHFNITENGSFRRRTRRVSGTAPSDTEAYRAKFALLAAAWEMVRLSRNSRRAVQGYCAQVWVDHVEFILGPRVRLFEVSLEGNKRARASWDFVLDFDWYIRDEAAYTYEQATLTTW